MKSDLQRFYEEQMWAEGMPAFDELNDEQRNTYESMVMFAFWKLRKAAQEVRAAIKANINFKDGGIVSTKPDGEFKMPNRFKK